MKMNDVFIRSVLYEKGITQTELANRAGLGRSTVASVCNGKSISGNSAIKIAEALGLSIDDLLKK